MIIAMPKITTLKLSVIGLILCGCAPVKTHSHCHDHCPIQVERYCEEIPPGYVLSQDKYDPNFVPCKPRPILPGPPGNDPNPDPNPDPEPVQEGQWSSTGGGNGAQAQQGDQSSEANAGAGANATYGDVDTADGQNSTTGGGRGAGATEGGVSIGTNGRDLL